VPLPTFSGSAARRLAQGLLWARSLRRRRYRVGALAQPGIGRSRARGLLLIFPFAVGAREVYVVDAARAQIARRVTPRAAAVDFVRWLAWQPISLAIALAGAAVAGGLSRRLTPPPAHGAARGGPAVYLRTDIELAGAPLAAGGSVAHTDGILGAVARQGFDLEFWCTGRISGLSCPVEHRPLPVVARGNVPTEIAELLSSLLQVSRLRRSPPPAAFVYQRYSLNNLTGLFLARRWRAPLILEANASEVKWRQDWSALRFPALARACERLLLSGASRIAVVSENAAADLLAMGADRGRLVVVPNAADVERFAGAPAVALPFPPDAVVVAFAGLFYPWHGVRYLARAFVALADACPAARLLLVGDGEDAAYVRSILGEAGLSERLHMPGLVAREDVPRYLAAADILVSPHAPIERFIGSPVKIFEYMAAGRAIVASRVAQIGEILTDRETALLVAAGDEHALALAMLELCRDAPLRARLAENAQAEARASHSWDARLATILGSGGW
jgi:glycosyltransferase involved in cell wall biosynthesis